MAITVTYSDEFLTSTMLARLKWLRKMQDVPYHVTEMVMRTADQEAGGNRILIPWDVRRHSNTTQHTTGYEDIDLTLRQMLTPGIDDWGWWVSPIGFSWVDEAKNRSKHQVIKLIETRTDDTKKRKEREVETQILRATQATMSDMNSWNGDDDANGFIESAATGTQSNVVHGVSKLTYATLPQFQNQSVDYGGAFGTTGIPLLIRGHNRVRQITDDTTKLEGFASYQFAENYLRTTQNQQRYGSEARDAVGLDLLINGIKYKQSQLMPNNGVATSVTNKEWSHLVVDSAVIKFVAQQGLKMNMMGFRDLTGARLVKVALLQLAGQNVCHAWGSSLVGIGGDTF